MNAEAMMEGGSTLSTIADGLITADEWLEEHSGVAKLLSSAGTMLSGAMWLKNITPVGFVSAIVVTYGYDKLMLLLELDTAKDNLSTYLQGFDSDLNKEQADILAGAAIKFAKEAGRVLTHKYANKGMNVLKDKLKGPEQQPLVFYKEYTSGKKGVVGKDTFPKLNNEINLVQELSERLNKLECSNIYLINGGNKIKISCADKFLINATESWGDQGLTVLGRAFQKHAGREGSLFQGVKFSHKTANQESVNILSQIVNSPNKVFKQASSGGQYIFDKITGRWFCISREGLFNGFRELDK